ncbi:alpha/beta hydrolase [soil metagenome]
MTNNKHTIPGNDIYWTYHRATLPVIIMIHGFRGTHHGLDLIAKKMPNNHIIVPDLPGFGEAKPLSQHGLDDYVLWLEQFIKSLNINMPPILLGHSFGSIVTSAYAARYPSTISKLILVNPIGSPALEGPRALLTKLALFYYWTGRKLPSGIAKKWLSAKPVVAIVTISMSKTKDKSLRRYIHDQHFAYFSRFHNTQSLSESFSTSVNNNVRQFADKITVPTLLVVGEKDDITPLHKQRELVELFPYGRISVINDVGHLTHYETPDQVATAIEQFI